MDTWGLIFGVKPVSSRGSFFFLSLSRLVSSCLVSALLSARIPCRCGVHVCGTSFLGFFLSFILFFIPLAQRWCSSSFLLSLPLASSRLPCQTQHHHQHHPSILAGRFSSLLWSWVHVGRQAVHRPSLPANSSHLRLHRLACAAVLLLLLLLFGLSGVWLHLR